MVHYPLINLLSWVGSADVFLLLFFLPYMSCCLESYTSQIPTKTLWGITFGVFGEAAAYRPNILWSTLPIQKSVTELTLIVSFWCQEVFALGRSMVTQNKYLYSVSLMKVVYTYDITWNQLQRQIQISNVPERMVLCCSVTCYIFLRVEL